MFEGAVLFAVAAVDVLVAVCGLLVAHYGAWGCEWS